MTFTVVAVRTGEEPESDLYPDPGDRPDAILLEPEDGSVAVHWLSTFDISPISGDRPGRQIIKLTDIAASLTVTDTRVAIACSKYDKGGGWSGFGGGLVLATGINAVSRARAARRRRGKMLVGHVRYEWLDMIEAKDRAGMLSANQLSIILRDPTGTGRLVLNVRLDKKTPASGVADQIIRRAALHRASHDSDQAQIDALRSFADSPPIERLDNGRVRYTMPLGNA